MNKIRFLKKSLIFLVLSIITTNVWSYGGGGGYKTECKEPAFKNQKPPKSSVVAPGSEFSFTASQNTIPGSIKASVKGIKVKLEVKDYYGLQVTGNIPAELIDVYAVIKISGYSHPKSCITEESWLIKISE